jgi:hypothetical protein
MTVHYSAGQVEYVVVAVPELSPPVQEALGPPELQLPSYLEGAAEQWAYPGLGLSCHVAADGRPNWLYAFGPTTVPGYLEGSLSQVRTLRHTRRVRP